ncbi:MAG TPA: BtrH N-terminal domain-containing protein [Pseudonocardiaceae bacterium]
MSTCLPMTSWYDDLCSCLQVDVACVLRFHGWDPVRALGASWRFTFVPGTCEPVEFYHPCRDEDLADALAAGQPLHAEWRWPSDAADAAAQLRAAIDAGRPPIVAVDNYHLPFRPAYRDVHAAHLVVVRGYDGDTVQVLDPMPPAFDGSLADSALATSRAAATVTDRTDPFFAGSSLRGRWLEVYPTGRQPDWSWAWVERILRDNLSALAGPARDDSGRLTGLAGFAAYVEDLPDRARVEGEKLRQELYVLGWWTQAAAALHGQFLSAAGQVLHRPDLVAAGRLADRVAHEWTGLRIAAAHGGDSALLPGRLRSRGRRVLRAWEQAVGDIGDALGAAA